VARPLRLAGRAVDRDQPAAKRRYAHHDHRGAAHEGT